MTSFIFGIFKWTGYSLCRFSAISYKDNFRFVQGPVDQGIVSLTNSLVVKMLTVLVSTISNLQVFLLKICE